jgi:hypothetical protein
MEKKIQHQIVITTDREHEDQKLPLNLIIPLAAGAIAGVAGVLGIFLGVEILLGL